MVQHRTKLHNTHYGLDKMIMKKRIETYEKAKTKSPERWSKYIRDWTLPEYVTLNPINTKDINILLQENN